MLWRMADVYDLERSFVNLGLDGSTDLLEGTDSFFPDLVSGKLGVGPGRLLSFFAFEGPWDSWEVHPNGDEIVLLREGRVLLESRLDSSRDDISRTIVLDAIRQMRPIMTAELCTGCHGEREAFPADLGRVIAKHYPEDAAVGFAAGDLRGAFTVKVPLE